MPLSPLGNSDTAKSDGLTPVIALLVLLVGVLAFFAGRSFEAYQQAKGPRPVESAQVSSAQSPSTNSAQEAPRQPLAQALQQRGRELSEQQLAEHGGDDKRAIAATMFLGYYLLNTQTRPRYCETQGVKLTHFVHAFVRRNTMYHAKSRVILLHASPDLDAVRRNAARLEPTVARALRESMEDTAALADSSVRALCQSMDVHAEQSAEDLALEKTNPAVAQVLNESP